MIGEVVSHYKIIEQLGAGGMGIVYRAEDLKLGRTIAIKFLPPELTRDAEAKTRFVHEARAASYLQHDNICTIHDFDESKDGQLFIVMDYYRGKTLKDKLAASALDSDKSPDKGKDTRRPGLPAEEAIPIAIQIARGLAKAHENNIVHRDIKPANIIVTEENSVKILDFGLAKLAGQTMLTRAGSTLGTVAYMSPEQAQGAIVDQRTDIWSLGVVLYEMLSGELPFGGEYAQAIMYAILHEVPRPLDLGATKSGTVLQAIVGKALQKNPDDRYQNMGEFIADLANLSAAAPVLPAKPSSVVSHKGWTAALLAFFVLAAVAVIVRFVSGRPAQKPPWLSSDAVYTRLTSEPGNECGKISPDGNYLVYQDDSYRIKLKVLSSGETRLLAPSVPGSQVQPSWSPDGTQVVFAKWAEDGMEVITCSLLGTVIMRFPCLGEPWQPAWSPDGKKIAYLDESEKYFHLVIAGIDTPGQKAYPLSGFAFWPTWSPDSRNIWLMAEGRKSADQLVVIDASNGVISDSLRHPSFNRGGCWYGGMTKTPDDRYLLYAGIHRQNAELMAMPLSGSRLAKSDAPIVITANGGNAMSIYPAATKDNKKISFSLVEDNSDIYIMDFDSRTARMGGRIIDVAADRRNDSQPCWSPDEKQIVFVSDREGQQDLYALQLENGTLRRLTFSKSSKFLPRITPDGRLSFFADRTIWIMPLQGGMPTQAAPKSLHLAPPYDWSHDGQYLIAATAEESHLSNKKLLKIKLVNSAVDTLLRGYVLHSMAISPDDQWLAFSGSLLTPDSILPGEVQLLNMRNGTLKSLLTFADIVPRGALSWGPDSKFVFHLQIASRYIYQILPVSGAPPREVQVDRGKLANEVLPEALSPSGSRILVTESSEEADVWMIGPPE